MALILTEFLPYSLVLWRGTIREPRLDQQVLWVWKSDERVNEFLKIVGRNLLKILFMKRQFSREIFLGNSRMLDSINKRGVWALRLRKYIILKDFFSKTKNLLIEFKFCAQKIEE